jgi:hypothetical protein
VSSVSVRNSESNFRGIAEHFREKGWKVFVPTPLKKPAVMECACSRRASAPRAGQIFVEHLSIAILFALQSLTLEPGARVDPPQTYEKTFRWVG